MKADLDRLMAEANLDAIVIFGDKAPNPYRDYLTNRSHATGSVFKKRNETPIFVVQSGMETGEAASSGLPVYTLHDFGQSDLGKKHSGAADLIARDLICNIFRQLNITGRVAIFGVADINNALVQLMGLRESLPEVDIVLGGAAAKLFDRAYATKDDHELAELKKVGQLTAQVVKAAWDFIGSQRAQDGLVIDVQGKVVTIGDVKRVILQKEMELGIEEAHGTIFAQGRDAGIPHSQGTDSDPLRLGQSIVFDISPKMTDSGYFHDMTRTWCIGHANPDVQTAYDQVMGVFHEAYRMVKVGLPTSEMQNMACDYFEEMGHPTARSMPGTMDGYVHSLGHGLGLNIHEAPFFRVYGADTLESGNVFTIEPGLYYPERGYGVRVEDTVYLDGEGKLHTLTDFPYDLVLPLKG